MAFHVGQKVVCVDKSRGFQNMLGDWFDDPDLVIGGIYTVTWTGSIEGRPAICIAEIPIRRAPPGKNATNAGKVSTFGAARFRPTVEKKSTAEAGMAILREILDRESVEDRKPARVRE